MSITAHALRIATTRAAYFLFWASIVGIPIYGPLMPTLEGRLFPVTSPLNIIDVRKDDGGISFRFTYFKARACEFLGADARLNGDSIDFYPTENVWAPPSTRNTGAQVSRYWHLSAPSLEGVSIYWTHRCSPFWLTISKVYP